MSPKALRPGVLDDRGREYGHRRRLLEVQSWDARAGDHQLAQGRRGRRVRLDLLSFAAPAEPAPPAIGHAAQQGRSHQSALLVTKVATSASQAPFDATIHRKMCGDLQRGGPPALCDFRLFTGIEGPPSGRKNHILAGVMSVTMQP